MCTVAPRSLTSTPPCPIPTPRLDYCLPGPPAPRAHTSAVSAAVTPTNHTPGSFVTPSTTIPLGHQPPSQLPPFAQPKVTLPPRCAVRPALIQTAIQAVTTIRGWCQIGQRELTDVEARAAGFLRTRRVDNYGLAWTDVDTPTKDGRIQKHRVRRSTRVRGLLTDR